MSTLLEIKRGIGRPKPTDFSDDGGELAIDHQTLTLWSKETQAGVVGRVGLADWLALDGTSKMDANLDVDGFTVVNARLPTDDYDVANKLYVDMSQDWERISNTGFQCIKDQQYLVEIVGSNPYVSLPTLTNQDIGKFVVIADGSGVWDLPGRSLRVVMNGQLSNEPAITEIVLDIARVIVTFIWDGYSWSVFTTSGSVDSASGSPWVETNKGIEYTGRIDTGEVHTHTLEAEYFLGTPRRHYEAVFGRSVPLDQELDSLEKRSVRHGVEIERIEKFIEQVRADQTNHPVVHEATYDDAIYGRQNGEWVSIPTGGTGEGHDIAAMFFWETKDAFGTKHEGQRWIQFNVAETYNPGYDLMLPNWSLVHQVELQVAYFKGKNPNTGAQYNPRVRLSHINFKNEVIKEDVLIHNQEMGWGQGFERDEQMFQVRLERGASKIRVDIDNVDGSNMDTSVSWEGKTYKNLIAVNGMYLTTDESQK